MNEISQRTCLRCGNPLPVLSSASRRYCDECGKQRNIELTRERQRKALKRAYEVRMAKQEVKDKAWCRKCIYHGSENYGNYLCDYILLTGKRRGCKPGEGCNQRRLK